MPIAPDRTDESSALREEDPREHRTPGADASLRVEWQTIAGESRPVARPTGCDVRAGLIVMLDGTRLLRRVGRLVDDGELDPRLLPVMVGIDPDEADKGLAQYTPWHHPAYRPGAPDFGGGADTFLADVVLPAAREVRGGGVEGPLGLLGYSLAGLFCLRAMELTDAFDTYLIASPSTWYPGFVNHLARTPLAGDPRVVIACGANEGLDHPEPITGIRQDTDRLVATLSAKLTRRPLVITDELDHHRGLATRLHALLGHWA